MFREGDGRPEDPNIISARGLFTRRRDLFGSRRNRPVDQLLQGHEGETDSLGSFKTTTTFSLRNVVEGRVFHTCCSSCFPDNRRKVAQKFTTLPVRNCLNVKQTNKEYDWYIRYFASLAHFLAKKNLASSYSLVESQNLISQNPDLFLHPDNDDQSTKEKTSALEFLNSFGVHPLKEAQLSRRIRFGGWLASKYFGSVFDGVCVHDGQISLLKALQKHHPVIYLPLQRSNWDHFLLSMVLIDSDMKVPLLIARKSLLQDSILGTLAKWTGLCLGCRPGCTDENKRSETDTSHRSDSTSIAHAAYLTSLLKEGMDLEFSVEKHRSRTGKPGTVFIGTEFVNLILQLVKNKEIEDAIIVPVSINYEKFPEEYLINNSDSPDKRGFLRQLWICVRSLVNCFIGRKNQRLGYARIDFAHPISVREFQGSVMTPSRVKPVLELFTQNNAFWMTDGYCNPIASSNLNWDDDAGSVASLSSVYADTKKMMPDSMGNDVLIVADTLTSHIIYDGWRASPLMSTHLLAFLLLTRYRQGATLETLVHDLNELLVLFREMKCDVGVYKKSQMNCVIQRAVDLLGRTLITTSKCDSGKSMLFKPKLDPSSLRQLGYYSNHITSHLAMAGIIATALFALRGPKLKLYSGTALDIYVNENELIETVCLLVKFLKAEFILYPPCQQLEDAVKSAIDNMGSDVLKREMARVSGRQYYTDDDDARYGGGDYDDQSFDQRIIVTATQDPSIYRMLCQLRSIITPYLQVYVEAFLVLYEMLPPDENAKSPCIPELILRDKMLQKVLQISSIPAEVVVMDTFVNFLVSMKEFGIIAETVEDGKIGFYLEKSYATKDKLNCARNNMLSLISF